MRIIVIGAGFGGLAAAIDLAARGAHVTLVEQAASPGGKARRLAPAGFAMDAGPTVFTMRWVFEALFAAAGARLDDHVGLTPAALLARHAWLDGARLDLFADQAASCAAITAFAGPREAEGFRAFCADAAAMHAVLQNSFMAAPRPTPLSLLARLGPNPLSALGAIRPFQTLWSALGDYFSDPRLQQLFARFATYCGSSPFRAPATLMVIAHVELAGVAYVQGGMHALALAMARLAQAQGAALRFGAQARRLLVRGGKVYGVALADGTQLAGDAVVFNGDPAALQAGLFGLEAQAAVPQRRAARSLSAVTWCVAAHTQGFPLARHTVFFSDPANAGYRAEFQEIFESGRPPRAPSVYVCAQDRDDRAAPPDGPERLFILTNAPARGAALSAEDIATCEETTFARLRAAGLIIEPEPQGIIRTSPADFEAAFPGAGGALYGPATHGAMASFQRPAARTRLAGLYLAGGATHPSAGVPMATLSGRLAAMQILQDFDLTPPWPLGATPGGTWTPSATTPDTA